MESQPQNPEFRNNHENFYPCPLLASDFFGPTDRLCKKFDPDQA